MKRRIVRKILVGLAVAPLVYFAGLYLTIPDIAPLAQTAPDRTSFMAESSGRASRFAPLATIAPILVCAVIKAEDKKFFFHGGFDWAQLERAIRGRLSGERNMGGSTITQQLARNLYLTREQSLHRKAREALIARALEARLPKRRILELYLNLIEWGPGVWGIAGASEYYFQKTPQELDVLEAVFLIGLIAAPSRALEGANLKRASEVQQRVLRQLEFAQVIDAEHAASVRAELAAVHQQVGRGGELQAVLNARASIASPAASLDVVLARCGEARLTETSTAPPDRVR